MLKNAGIVHFLPNEPGIDLTVDLCPSKLQLDRIIFTRLIDELGAVESPVPLGISVTGLWMNAHRDDIQWLIADRRIALHKIARV